MCGLIVQKTPFWYCTTMPECATEIKEVISCKFFPNSVLIKTFYNRRRWTFAKLIFSRHKTFQSTHSKDDIPYQCNASTTFILNVSVPLHLEFRICDDEDVFKTDWVCIILLDIQLMSPCPCGWRTLVVVWSVEASVVSPWFFLPRPPTSLPKQ